MKTTLITGLLALMLSYAFKLTDGPNLLIGRWENIRTYRGSKISLVGNFKVDGSYSGFINHKAFVTGKYQLKHDTLYIDDSTCGAGYLGTYKVQFFGQDSLKFHVIQDTCQYRREGTNGFLFKKLK
jgi:hypothetical protein